MTTKVSDLELRESQSNNWELYRISHAHGTNHFVNDFVYARRRGRHTSYFDIVPSLQMELADPNRYQYGYSYVHEYCLEPAQKEELDQYEYLVFLYGRKTSFQKMSRIKNEFLKAEQYQIRTKLYYPIKKGLKMEEIDLVRSQFLSDKEAPQYVKAIRDNSEWTFLLCTTDNIVFK